MDIPAYTQTRWSLTDLIPSAEKEDVEAAFNRLDEDIRRMEARRAELRPELAPETFLDLLRELEGISKQANRLEAFAGLWFAEDTQNQAAQSLVARVDQFMASAQNRILFFSLWWKGLEDGPAERLMEGSGDYRYWLEEMRHFKPHTLSEPEEKIINIKDVTGVNAINMLYDSITNRYTFKLEVEGVTKELTRGELMVYARSDDPDLRAKAYQELYRVYGQDGPILGQIYQAIVRDWRNEQVDLRHFRTPISARNLGNDIPDEVVETLLQVSRQNAGLYQRYFRLKARWLEMGPTLSGKDGGGTSPASLDKNSGGTSPASLDKNSGGTRPLRRYDIYAPVAKSEKTYAFDQAAGMVFDSFQSFDPDFANLARRVFNENHLDSEVRKGKRGGAFCSTVIPELTPWVMVNYQGRAEDVATMAHELGHAIHSMLAAGHTLFTQHASLPLAETASTFGEMMLVDRLLRLESDEAVRRDLLFRQVDDSYATILRQAYFALFETQAHQMIQEGASVDDLAEAYLENLRQQFGDAVEVEDEFRWEWVSIPHIYGTPFYVYAYAFGQLLVLALYQQYKEEGEAFKPRYRSILAAGGSEAPVKLLAKAGIDVYQPAFWQGGFDVVRGMIEQLEAMPVKTMG